MPALGLSSESGSGMLQDGRLDEDIADTLRVDASVIKNIHHFIRIIFQVLVFILKVYAYQSFEWLMLLIFIIFYVVTPHK